MNDPHVERLRYRLKVDPNQLSFKNPPPISQEYDAFRIRLDDGILIVDMKEHHASVKSAKEKVEGFIQDWMIHAALDFDWNLLKFEYENAEVIDRKPSPKVPGQVTGQGILTLPMLTVRGTATVLPLKRSEYPAPPIRFRATPDVETMWFRYHQHLQDKETYQALGYFCLSLMEWRTGVSPGARDAASRIYNIKLDVLKKLGKLTTVTGSVRDARKLGSGSTLIPLTDSERRWIREAVKMLILRKGEYDFDPATAASLKQITMADLPL
jgi:hypothetical protein